MHISQLHGGHGALPHIDPNPNLTLPSFHFPPLHYPPPSFSLPLSTFLLLCFPNPLSQSNTTMSLVCTALTENSPCYPQIAALIESEATTVEMSLTVSPRGDMSDLQANLELILSDPLDLLTPRCRSAGLPLYCNFLFPPCYNGSIDPTLQLTRSRCNTLVEDICKEEFHLIEWPLFDYIRERVPHLIPNCDTQPENGSEVRIMHCG